MMMRAQALLERNPRRPTPRSARTWSPTSAAAARTCASCARCSRAARCDGSGARRHGGALTATVDAVRGAPSWRGGGALVVGFSLAAARCAARRRERRQRRRPSRSCRAASKTTPMLDAWIRIDADGAVTVFTGKAELGQGIKTALLQIAAEELTSTRRASTLVTADTARTPNEGYTAGSHSMQDSGTAIRNAAAQVREILIGAAAERLGVAGRAAARRGRRGRRGRTAGAIGYGELVAGRAAACRTRSRTSPAEAGRRSSRVMGKPLPRVDIPAKVTGGAAYVQDLRLPGMVHARVVRPPSYGARLQRRSTRPRSSACPACEGRARRQLPRRRRRARVPGDQGDARARGAARMGRAADACPTQRDLYATLLRAAGAGHGASLERRHGARRPACARSRRRYRRPYQMHGSIGPSCAVAPLRGRRADGLDAHARASIPLRDAIAEMLRRAAGQGALHPRRRLRLLRPQRRRRRRPPMRRCSRAPCPAGRCACSGCASRSTRWEPFGPAMVTQVARARSTPTATIAAWHYEVWSNTPHRRGPGGAGELLAGQAPRPAVHAAAAEADAAARRRRRPQRRSRSTRFPNARVVHHFMPEHAAARLGAARRSAPTLNVFSIESFMDELARSRRRRSGRVPPAPSRGPARAGRRPAAAAERFGWNGRPQPAAAAAAASPSRATRTSPPTARSRWRSRSSARPAACASCAPSPRSTAARSSIPDGIRNQIEGGIVQSTSWTLYEEVTLRPRPASRAATGAATRSCASRERAGERRGARHRPAGRSPSSAPARRRRARPPPRSPTRLPTRPACAFASCR